MRRHANQNAHYLANILPASHHYCTRSYGRTCTHSRTSRVSESSDWLTATSTTREGGDPKGRVPMKIPASASCAGTCVRHALAQPMTNNNMSTDLAVTLLSGVKRSCSTIYGSNWKRVALSKIKGYCTCRLMVEAAHLDAATGQPAAAAAKAAYPAQPCCGEMQQPHVVGGDLGCVVR